ncbi:MAG: hypothetical protein GX628_00155 [Clostridiales bacterium]|nr:hypothetical protein [Clostridiales bacterium]
MADKRLTAQVKEFARKLGADLVGIASIDRFDTAPIKMSPQGILPTAKSVVVCAVHHPDATIELEGGERGDSQIFESYAVQYVMNSKLDHLSYNIGRFLDSKGYDAVPIVSSNIWRYRSYKELDAVFSPDMSHIYSSVAAGLSSMGWNGLALTPEYGPRNRFVSIITDAELEPTPMVEEKLCDMCGECIRCCPTDAYRKQCDGAKTISFKGRVHRFANKNLWRCAWGEHFDIDLDDEIPEYIDEDVIIKRLAEKGRRGGEFGVCLKVCVPPQIRERDESYSKYNRRRRLKADLDAPVSREAFDIMTDIGLKYHIEKIVTVPVSKFAERGVDLTKKLPKAQSVIYVAATYENAPSSLPAGAAWKVENPITGAIRGGLNFASYDIARQLEKWGYDTMAMMSSLYKFGPEFVEQTEGVNTIYGAVLTNAPLPEKSIDLRSGSELRGDLKTNLWEIAKEFGADMMGVAPASRIEDIRRQLSPLKDGEKLFNVRDKNPAFHVFDPEVSETKRELFSPYQYVEGAKSVIVIGSHYPSAPALRAGRPPAEAIGPFIFAQSQGLNELNFIGAEVIAALKSAGYKAYMTHDLLGAGTVICSPRGMYSSPFDSALEAVAAGLGQLTYGGYLNTDKFGTTQKLICIITDAPLAPDPVQANTVQATCDDCRKCFENCPMKAHLFDERINLNIGGVDYTYVPLNTVHCQWASKYALTKRDGFEYLGCELDEMPGENEDITVEMLKEALRKRDPITKGRPAAAEQCFVHCPLIK